MTKVIGVRFRRAGKIYFFAPGKYTDISEGDHVIVETARGVEYGNVVLGIRDVEYEKVIQPLKAVIRVATPEDDAREAKNREKEKEAFKICLEKIAKHKLAMKLIKVEYTFDNNKILFYFTADGRIDFRELVKDLASVFKTRIELRQIGVRDEAKIRGGIGACGRPLCCATYMPEFIPVSIKMAKEQNLSLNPTKISGVCGRLMCCLKNEEEAYEDLNSRLPAVGDFVTTSDKLKGEVTSVNVLRQRVKVTVTLDGDEKEIREYVATKDPMDKAGMDAVLLSSFATAGKNASVLDLCSGNGVIPILMHAKNPQTKYVGIEIQDVAFNLAQRNASLNNISGDVVFVQGNIKEIKSLTEGRLFDVVTTNPPYMTEKHGIVNPESAKAIARHELLCNLDDVVKAAADSLKVHGRFFMVHRPKRLVQIFDSMTSHGLEPKRIRMVHPYDDKAANMVLIEAVKGGKPQLDVEPPLIVYNHDGSYTQELLKMYGDNADE